MFVSVPEWIACCSQNCVDCTRSSPGFTTMDARAVLQMVLNPPSLRFEAEIYQTNALNSHLVHATAWLLSSKCLSMYWYLNSLVSPLRHAEWRSGTRFRITFLRYVVTQAFFAFVCKPSKYLILIYFWEVVIITPWWQTAMRLVFMANNKRSGSKYSLF